MTNYRRGDVVLLPFPFSDLTSTKQRPALVISSDHYNDLSQDVIAAAITLEPLRIHIPGDYFIRGWQEAGLIAESTVRCSKLLTIHSFLVKKVIGKVSKVEMDEIAFQLKELFEIAGKPEKDKPGMTDMGGMM